MADVRTGTPVFTTDGRMRITLWNRAAEAFSGIAAGEAVGRPCWEVVRGLDGNGLPVCRPGCVVARMIAGQWEVNCRDLAVAFPSGRGAATLSTVVVDGGDGRLILHELRDAGHDRKPAVSARLTARQREILHLLGNGVRVREIAARLVLAEATVRNHVQAILLELGVHSQIEAVARGRLLGLIDGADPGLRRHEAEQAARAKGAAGSSRRSRAA